MQDFADRDRDVSVGTRQAGPPGPERPSSEGEKAAVKGASAPAGTPVGEAAAGGLYTAESDAHYRDLWDSAPDRPADRSFDAARPAFQFGHVAAQLPEFAGLDFTAAEPELRRRWPAELRGRAGDWELVRRDVEAAYGHARSQGFGVVRDSSVVGSAGSAVDPDELARARGGMPSREDGAGFTQVSGPSDAWESSG